jgi:hypothetical protein
VLSGAPRSALGEVDLLSDEFRPACHFAVHFPFQRTRRITELFGSPGKAK